MSLAQTLEVFEALDSALAGGPIVAQLFAQFPAVEVSVQTLTGPEGATDFVRIAIGGTRGKRSGGSAPTLGVIGRLGGIGARPSRIGLVSDADGAIAAVAAALKLAKMATNGDGLPGDVVVTTHICPRAPIRPHHPVDHMDNPVGLDTLLDLEVEQVMDAIVSIDSTKANNFINHKGIAISPTVRDGYILRTPDALVRILERTTGRPAVIFPITTQDITPYRNGIHHLNSIMQPSVRTSAPVIGVAITSEAMVPGSSAGGTQEIDVAAAVRFTVEVAKDFTTGLCSFCYDHEFAQLKALYGSLRHLQEVTG